MTNKELPLKLRCPQAKAAPSEIRSFITNVLIVKHEVEPEEAAKIAEKWGIGRGPEFHSLMSGGYEAMFGSEIGGPLGQSISELRIEEWSNKPRIKLFYYCWRICFPMSAVVLYLAATTPSNFLLYDAYTVACLLIGGPLALAYDAPDERCLVFWPVMICVFGFVMVSNLAS